MNRALVVATAAALALGGCAGQLPLASSPAADDDVYCQLKGFKPGSDEYVRCRKDRDDVASTRAKRETSTQQKLGDFMMEHR